MELGLGLKEGGAIDSGPKWPQTPFIGWRNRDDQSRLALWLAEV